jgi:hypothetical protein
MTSTSTTNLSGLFGSLLSLSEIHVHAISNSQFRAISRLNRRAAGWLAGVESVLSSRRLAKIIPATPGFFYGESSGDRSNAFPLLAFYDMLPALTSFQVSGFNWMILKARRSGKTCCHSLLTRMKTPEWSKPSARKVSCVFRQWKQSFRGGVLRHTPSDE